MTFFNPWIKQSNVNQHQHSTRGPIASVKEKRTIFSNTQAFKACSARRQCHNWWLFCSRHSQWARNCCRQFSLISLSLEQTHIRISRRQLMGGQWKLLMRARNMTYTLAAHRVTFLPSLRHSNSPLPFASVLHFI
jgi:hypothetical protein